MATPELIAHQPLADLLPNQANPRRCPKGELAKLKANLERHGHLGTLVARRLATGGLRLISGHQRAQALAQLGHTTAACWLVDCDDQAEQELLLQLNGHAGEWAADQLDSILASLASSGADLDGIQIDHKALDRHLAEQRAALEADLAQAQAQQAQAETGPHSAQESPATTWQPGQGPGRPHEDYTDEAGYQLPLDAEGLPEQTASSKAKRRSLEILELLSEALGESRTLKQVRARCEPLIAELWSLL